jgi:flagellin-specific chaperone FliS
MTYEETIAEMSGYDLVLRTKSFDLSKENEQEKFKFLADRLRNILKQIEIHEDYEDFLEDKKTLDQITDVLTQRMSKDYEKKNEFVNKLDDFPDF